MISPTHNCRQRRSIRTSSLCQNSNGHYSTNQERKDRQKDNTKKTKMMSKNCIEHIYRLLNWSQTESMMCLPRER